MRKLTAGKEQTGLKRLGRGYFKTYRFNPYNPLSYVALIYYTDLMGILMFGVRFGKKHNLNPFQWD